MAIYTLTFHGGGRSPLERVREEDVRLEITAKTIATISAAEERAVMVLPAGFVHARSAAQRDRWASQLTDLSREHGVALAFGIDVADEDAWEPLARPRSFAFACDRGRKLLWAVSAGGATLTGMRSQLLADHRCLLLLDGEIFQSVSSALVHRLRPDLVLVLSHGGATPRWIPVLAELERSAPTLVVHNHLPKRRSIRVDEAHGWNKTVMTSDRMLTIHRHLPRPLDGVSPPYVGH